MSTLLHHSGLNAFGFYPYQQRWLLDESRFKIGLWARQTGKDFCAAAEGVFDCRMIPGSTWVVLAAGERQALESISKAKEWARTLDFVIEDYHESFGETEVGRRGHGRGRRGSAGTMLSSAEIKWSNGSRFIALPAKPETIRGYSANLILTEFAFHDDPEGIWRAIYPSISNPLRGGEKKVRIISTPNGLNNKFADLWHNGAGYSKHRTNIYEAVRDGLTLDIEKLKAGLNDPEAWTQEYECEFIDSSSILLPYDLIQSCESGEASEVWPELLDPGSYLGWSGQSSVFMGIDFARKNHLTVAWVLEKRGNQYLTRHVLALRNKSTPEQIELLRPLIKRMGRVAVDYTGGGLGWEIIW
jgi:phage FluMu gp28-like protein